MPDFSRLTASFGLIVLLLTSPAHAQAVTGETAHQLHTRHADYLATTGRQHEALALLLARDQTGSAAIAELFARAGLLDRARHALRDVPNGQAGKARLALAQAEYRAGEWGNAETSLRQVSGSDSAAPSQSRPSLLARSLLRRHEDSEAARTLQMLQARQRLDGIDEYNLGAAWLRSGALSKGIGMLEHLGRYRGEAITEQALADQANLALGYWYLQQQRFALAQTAFERIRLGKPLELHARLGLHGTQLRMAADTSAGERAQQATLNWQWLVRDPRLTSATPLLLTWPQILAARGKPKAARQARNYLIAQLRQRRRNLRSPEYAQHVIQGLLATPLLTLIPDAANLRTASKRLQALDDAGTVLIRSQRNTDRVRQRLSQLIDVRNLTLDNAVSDVLRRLRGNAKGQFSHPGPADRGLLTFAYNAHLRSRGRIYKLENLAVSAANLSKQARDLQNRVDAARQAFTTQITHSLRNATETGLAQVVSGSANPG